MLYHLGKLFIKNHIQQELNEGYHLDLGKIADLCTATDPNIAVTIDQTRKSLLDLVQGVGDHPCYFVPEIKHGVPIMEVRDGTKAELTDFVLVFNRVRNIWNVVTKMWFDATKPQDEPNMRSGIIDSHPATNPHQLPSESTVSLSPSFEGKIKGK